MRLRRDVESILRTLTEGAPKADTWDGIPTRPAGPRSKDIQRKTAASAGAVTAARFLEVLSATGPKKQAATYEPRLNRVRPRRAATRAKSHSRPGKINRPYRLRSSDGLHPNFR